MARISSYGLDSKPELGDKVVGTDTSAEANLKTKNYSLQDVVDLFNKSNSVALADQSIFLFQDDLSEGREAGTVSFEAGGGVGTAFSSITSLIFSKSALGGANIANFLQLFSNKSIIIAEVGNINNHGRYKVTNISDFSLDPTFYEIQLSVNAYNGVLSEDAHYIFSEFSVPGAESTLQTTIDAGNTYQETASSPLWTWGNSALLIDGTGTPGGFYGVLSGKYIRLKSDDFPNYTSLGNGSLVIPLPGAVNTRFRLTANPLIEEGEEVGILSPATSGTLALTTDIIDSPWDTVLGGINYAAGNVGIGTETPLAKLQVFGGSAIIGDDDFNAVKISTNGSGTTYNTIGNGFIEPNVNFNINNQTRLTINGNSGNVGIGTTSPGAKLEVSGNLKISSDQTNLIKISNESNEDYFNVSQSTNNKPTLSLGDIDEQYGTLLTVDVESEEVAIFTNGTVTVGDNGFGNSTQFIVDDVNEKFTFTNGNVGIGTTSPSTNLEVATSNPSNGIKGVTNTGILWGNFINTNSNTFPVGKITLRYGATETASIIARSNEMKLGNSQANMTFYASSSERMRINSSGNVGIGTTSPGAKLHLFNAGYPQMALQSNGGTWQVGVSTGNDLVFRRGTSGSNYPLWLDSSDNVGIGTTSPSEKLDVEGNIRVGVNNGFYINNQNVGIKRVANDLVVGGFGGIRFTSSSTTVPNQAERMRITSTGNVGIGTTSPSEKLEVEGDIASQGIYVDRTHESGGISNPFAKFGLHYWWGDSNSITLQKTGNNNKYLFSTQSGYFHVVNASGNDVRITSSDQTVEVSLGILNLGVAQHGAANNNNGRYISISNAGNTSGSRGVVNVNGDFRINDYSTSAEIEKIKLKNDGSAYFTGNVGIGTTSPSQLLHIDLGTVDVKAQLNAIGGFDGMLVDGTNASYNLIGGNGDKYTLGALNDGSFRIYNEGGAGYALTLNNSGKLGIGTTDPQEKLDISAGSIRLDDGLSIKWGTIDANRGRVRITGNEANDFLQFVTDNSEKMRLTNTGLGIGTTAPLSKFQVDGQASLLGNGFYGLTHLKGTNALASYNTANKIVMSSNGSTDGLYTGGLHLTRRALTQQGHFGSGIRGISTGTVLQDNALELYTSTNTEQNATRLKITSTGNVGIGTTSPGEKLEVNGGEIRTTRENVPANYLSLSTTSAGSFIKNTGGTSKGLTFDNVSAASPYINFKLLSSEKMRINSSGNVGIGTTSPLNKLQVTGGSVGIDSEYMIRDNRNNTILLQSASTVASNRSLTIGNATYSNIIVPNGNVGIGTASPTSKLDVAGGDIELDDVAAGIIMRSPDGTKYRITVANGGTLTVTAV